MINTKIIIILLIINININQLSQQEIDECREQIGCTECCSKDSNGNYVCSSELLTCRLSPNENYSDLLIILLIIVGFLIGLPVLLTILDFLIVKRICFKMSICEFLINYLCLCICIKRKKKLIRKNDKKKTKHTNIINITDN